MNPNFNARATWLRTLERVLLDGEETEPAKRGALNSDGTKEIVACQTCVDMRYPVMTLKERRLSYRFMAGEAWWILTGHDDVASIVPYNKRIEQFSDDGVTFFGAYGPRVVNQLPGVVAALDKDLGTRQAVMTIWRKNPHLQAPNSKDIPCTVSLQWLVRNNRLFCIDTMRSSDLWLGWPYDVFNFSMLSLLILLELRERGHKKLILGDLWLQAGSQHIYKRNIERALACASDPVSAVESEPHFSATRFDSAKQLISYLKDCADGKKSILDPA